MSIDGQPSDIGEGELLSPVEVRARKFAEESCPSLAPALKKIGIAAGVRLVECDDATVRTLVEEIDTSDDPYVVGELARWGGSIGDRAKAYLEEAKGYGVPEEKLPDAELRWLRVQAAGTLASVAVRKTLGIEPSLRINEMGDKAADVSATIGLAADIATPSRLGHN